MAKNTKVTQAPVVEVEEIIEIEGDELDLGDLDLGEGVEEVIEEIDPMETELEEVSAPPVKAKRTPPVGSPMTSVQPLAEGEVGAAHIAEICGVEAKDIRAFLRANYRDMDSTKGQRYRFPEGDPMIQEIVDAFMANKKAKAEAPKLPPFTKKPAGEGAIANATPPVTKPAVVKPQVAAATKPVIAPAINKQVVAATKPAATTQTVKRKI